MVAQEMNLKYREVFVCALNGTGIGIVRRVAGEFVSCLSFRGVHRLRSKHLVFSARCRVVNCMSENSMSLLGKSNGEKPLRRTEYIHPMALNHAAFYSFDIDKQAFKRVLMHPSHSLIGESMNEWAGVVRRMQFPVSDAVIFATQVSWSPNGHLHCTMD